MVPDLYWKVALNGALPLLNTKSLAKMVTQWEKWALIDLKQNCFQTYNTKLALNTTLVTFHAILENNHFKSMN